MDVTAKEVTFHFEKMVGHVIDKINHWLTAIVQMIPNLVVAIIVLVVF